MTEPRLAARRISRRVTATLAVAAGGLGVLALLGWALGVGELTLGGTGGAPMRPATALGLVLCASALLAGESASRTLRLLRLPALAAALALTVLAALDPLLDFGDLARVLTAGADSQGAWMMAPMTAVLFTLLIGALAPSPARRYAPLSQTLALIALGLALGGVISYAYGAEFLFGHSRINQMALPTAAGMFTLALAVLTATAEGGLLRILLATDNGGRMARRLLPAAVALPLLAGWLRLMWQDAGLIEPQTGVAFSAVLALVLLCAMIYRTAQQVSHEEERRGKAEEALRENEAGLARQVELRTAELADANSALRREMDERQGLEQQLRQAQKMEAIGTLAGGIAHDFNNILYAIQGNAELVLDELPAGSRSRDNQREVLLSAQRASDLVRRILTFSRQAPGIRGPLSVADAAREVVQLLRSTLPATVEISLDADRGIPTVEAEPGEVHQVLMNLCTNAWQAMPAGGRLSVRVRGVQLDAPLVQPMTTLPAGSYVVAEVSDSGEGIPPEHLGRIFDPFFTTRDVGSGTGLGLSTVHGIVSSLGGTVAVASESGVGSTFSVYLPVSAGAKPPEPPRHAAGGTERVLLVDDEAALVRMGRQQLERLGYRVTAVTDSREALALLQSAPEAFDILVTDETMPGLRGSDLALAAAQLRPDLPVILCSGFAQQDEILARAPGIRTVLLKPVPGPTLARCIREQLDAAHSTQDTAHKTHE